MRLSLSYLAVPLGKSLSLRELGLRRPKLINEEGFLNRAGHYSPLTSTSRMVETRFGAQTKRYRQDIIPKKVMSNTGWRTVLSRRTEMAPHLIPPTLD